MADTHTKDMRGGFHTGMGTKGFADSDLFEPVLFFLSEIEVLAF